MHRASQFKKWHVQISDAASKMVERSNALSDDDKLEVITWARTVQKSGPDSLRVGPGANIWKDHDLAGPWAGYGASSFSNAGRIIYRVINNAVYVVIVRLTTTHEYGPPSESELTELNKLLIVLGSKGPKETKR